MAALERIGEVARRLAAGGSSPGTRVRGSVVSGAAVLSFAVVLLASVQAHDARLRSVAAGEGRGDRSVRRIMPGGSELARQAPGGHLVVLLAVRSRTVYQTQMVLAPAGGGALRPLGRPAAYAGVAVQPGAGTLALGSPSGLYLLAPGSATPGRLRLAGAPAQISVPAWSPDGRRLAFLAAPAPTARHAVALAHTLWTAERSGHNARQILDAARTADLLTVAWAPDRKSLLLSRFARGAGAVSRLDLATRRERLIGRGFDAVYSPDGHHIAYTVRGAPGQAHVWIFDTRTRRARPLGAPGLAQAAVPVWSPDGMSLAFFGTRATAPTFLQPYDLWTLAATGGAARRVAANVVTLLPVGQEALAWTSH